MAAIRRDGTNEVFRFSWEHLRIAGWTFASSVRCPWSTPAARSRSQDARRSSCSRLCSSVPTSSCRGRGWSTSSGRGRCRRRPKAPSMCSSRTCARRSAPRLSRGRTAATCCASSRSASIRFASNGWRRRDGSSARQATPPPGAGSCAKRSPCGAGPHSASSLRQASPSRQPPGSRSSGSRRSKTA